MTYNGDNNNNNNNDNKDDSDNVYLSTQTVRRTIEPTDKTFNLTVILRMRERMFMADFSSFNLNFKNQTFIIIQTKDIKDIYTKVYL